ncbi:MAG: hypothetical protein FWF02_00390 [Micrococcales bacterium]|nr:hypothetical protein [Micrococcales bacterium]MCL2666157.1 hypothetical protein [Micrococcales bacterium]
MSRIETVVAQPQVVQPPAMSPSPAVTTTQVPARWTDALGTVLGSLGPRRWEDIEDAVDYVLTGTPSTPPSFVGGFGKEQQLGGYETAHRIVLAGMSAVPPIVAIRWARLLQAIRTPNPRTMVPLAGGLFETLLEDIADVFGVHHIALDVAVLEDMAVELGLPPSAVLASAFTVGPDAHDPMPSRACVALSVMRGYDAALLRHAATLRVHIAQSNPASQCRANRMLARAANTTLRVYGQVIDAMTASPDPQVRASTRPLVQRRDVCRQVVVDELVTLHPLWPARGASRLSFVPQPFPA